MASGRKRSPIWKYFVLAEDSRLHICQLCKDEVPRGGQSTKSYMTTNLVHHLKTKHGQEYVEYEKKKSEKQNEAPQASLSNEAAPLWNISLMEAAELRKQWDINDASAKGIHRKIGLMIAVDCQPISVIENSDFKALIHALAPKYRIPSRKYFAETVTPNIAQGIRAEVQAKLQEGADYISFTTDVWSSDVNSECAVLVNALSPFSVHEWWNAQFFQGSGYTRYGQNLVVVKIMRSVCYQSHYSWLAREVTESVYNYNDSLAC